MSHVNLVLVKQLVLDNLSVALIAFLVTRENIPILQVRIMALENCNSSGYMATSKILMDYKTDDKIQYSNLMSLTPYSHELMCETGGNILFPPQMFLFDFYSKSCCCC